MKILKIALYISIFILSMLTFLPKDSIYYFAEQSLSKNDVVISNEKITKKIFGLNIANGTVTYGNIETLEFENMDMLILGFYNKISISSITNRVFLDSFLPNKTKNVKITYSIFHPLSVILEAQGGFGELNGTFDIFNKMVKIRLKPSDIMNKEYDFMLSKMKNENGVFTYEQKL
jgi:hypothetical protein